MALWINGNWMTRLDKLQVGTNPVSGDVLQHDNDADATQVMQTCQAARVASAGWAEQPFNTRQTIVERFVLLLENNKAELTQIITKGTGKPHWEAAIGLTAMIDKIIISVEAYHARTGEQYSELPGGAVTLRRHPHGVLAVFGPYNFPDHLPNGHIVPALLAGNTLTFKPSELTPWTGEAVTKLWGQTRLPPGVLDLIRGGREAGQALSVPEDLDGLLFTGGASTGYQLHKQLSGQPERILALEMGGNNPLIIENPEDTDAAVHLTIRSAFVAAGQHCTCARRLLVEKGAQGNVFLTRLVEVSQRLMPGNWGAQPQPFADGLISEQAMQHIYDAWQRLASLGGRALLAPCLVNAGASLLAPGIIELTGAGNVPDEGVLGPLPGVWRYGSFGNAIRMTNNTCFGLSCGLVSLDHDQFEQLLLEARTGIVSWSKPLTGVVSTTPFDGVGAPENHRVSTWYAAGYCAWPTASLESPALTLPTTLSPGLDSPREDKL